MVLTYIKESVIRIAHQEQYYRQQPGDAFLVIILVEHALFILVNVPVAKMMLVHLFKEVALPNVRLEAMPQQDFVNTVIFSVLLV